MGSTYLAIRAAATHIDVTVAMVTAQSKNFGLAAGAGAGLTIELRTSIGPWIVLRSILLWRSLQLRQVGFAGVILQTAPPLHYRFSIGFMPLPAVLSWVSSSSFVVSLRIRLASWSAGSPHSNTSSRHRAVPCRRRAIRSNFSTERLLSTPVGAGVAAIWLFPDSATAAADAA